MSSRVSLSPEERASLLQEARASDTGARVPVRTSGGGRKHSGGVKPPTSTPPGGRSSHGRGRGARRTLLVVLGLCILLAGLLSAKVLNVGHNVLSKDRSIFAQISDVLFRGKSKLKGESDDRINVLLLAVGGKGHSGENLADTIMVASIRPKEHQIGLLSLPRDLFVRLPGTESFTKINAVHAYYESSKADDGPKYLSQKVEEITGFPIHYYGRVDFTAFKDIVDHIGGVDIAIPASFFDYWHKISFPAGTEHMNGDRALAYVRARYVEGPEGGDFKRAGRQQQMLLAIRDKVFSVNTAFDLPAISGILDALSSNVSTNFQLWELKRLAELVRNVPKDHIHNAVMTTGPNGLLVGGTEILEGQPASVLKPRAGLENYSEIQALAARIFENSNTTPAPNTETVTPPPTEEVPSATPSPSPSPSPSSQPTVSASVEVRNGTTITGLASRVASTLKKQSFSVPTVGNAEKRNRTNTIVVDTTNGKNPDDLSTLLRTLGVTSVVSMPVDEQTSTAQFIVFLGTDVSDTFK